MTGRVVHIVPAGISLLNRITYDWPDDLRWVLDRRNLWDDLGTNPGAEVPDAVLGVGGASVSEVRVELDRAQPDTCAEWQALDQYQSEFDCGDQDTWVFVGTDTEEGSRAALLTALGFSRRQNIPLYAVTDPTETPGFTFNRGAYVVRIPGLDLTGSTEVPLVTFQALGALGRLVVLTVLQRLERCDVVFHLSGGYKAMLPYFLTTAQAVRTKLQRRKHGEVDAYCLHESSRRLVPLPVPYFTDVLCEWLGRVTSASDGGRVSEVDTRTAPGLVGLYLEDVERNGKHRLNGAGMIIAGTLCAAT